MCAMDGVSTRSDLGRRFTFLLLTVALLGSFAWSPEASAAVAFDPAGDCDNRVLLAAEAPPVGVSPCDGVRPGGFLENKYTSCSWNFLFKGSDGRRYMGTAGHCFDLSAFENGEKVWPRKGPWFKGQIDGEMVRVGEGAYAVNESQRDFGLVRLDKKAPASPSMCHFGGPSGDAVEPAQGTVLHHYGQGLIYGQTVPARSSVASDVGSSEWVQYSVGAALFGDSGSGAITEQGDAVGVLVHLSAFGVGISKLEPHLERAEKKLGVQLKLVTAPLE